MPSLVKKVVDQVGGAVGLWFAADGWIPNNPNLPVILYRAAIPCVGPDPAAAFEAAFRGNGWIPEWRNGVYRFHHYHSTAHEVLGFATGTARLILGGPNGTEIAVRAGDCALLPAGTGHCLIDSTAKFLVVGAYPPGQDWDLCRGPPNSVGNTRIEHVAVPELDPVAGADGTMLKLWSSAA